MVEGRGRCGCLSLAASFDHRRLPLDCSQSRTKSRPHSSGSRLRYFDGACVQPFELHRGIGLKQTPFPRSLEIWNRKIHFYLGLYLLLFLWLFAISGLLLNHPEWLLKLYWDHRLESSSEHTIQPLSESDPVDRALLLMTQLELEGELEVAPAKGDPGMFSFRVVRPGEFVSVDADFSHGTARVKRTRVNAVGIGSMLHTFTGVRANDQTQKRDWVMTNIWSFSMDAVAVGIIILILSSYYMWLRLGSKRLSGAVSLGSGFLVCLFFVMVISRL